MRRLRNVSLMILLALVTVSCDKYRGIQEEFMRGENEISLSIKGEKVFSYDPLTQQLGYDPGKREFRVMDDDMSDYFVIQLNKDLTQIGSSCSGTLKYTTEDEVITKTGISFTLQKTGDDGLKWLWSKKNGIGAVVRELK
ncbi:MAG: hypothetical protein MJY67_04400 [Bacteroidales bacterium]|nr:hypothetical protein [Bacteroidales bacterium]